jgi:hypothetical protein
MTRWSEAYKARTPPRDTVDTVDTVDIAPPVPPPVGYSVNCVNSVTLSEKENEAASNAAFEAAERAAIVAEGEFGNAAAPVPHFLPPSWADARIEPTPGAVCYSCRRRSWWCESRNPSGWRCATCRPPSHLQVGQFRVVAT